MSIKCLLFGHDMQEEKTYSWCRNRCGLVTKSPDQVIASERANQDEQNYAQMYMQGIDFSRRKGMKRGNRLVIPMGGELACRHIYNSSNFGGKSYSADIEQRVELDLDECEAIIANLPLIVDFVITERPLRDVKK